MVLAVDFSKSSFPRPLAIVQTGMHNLEETTEELQFLSLVVYTFWYFTMVVQRLDPVVSMSFTVKHLISPGITNQNKRLNPSIPPLPTAYKLNPV